MIPAGTKFSNIQKVLFEKNLIQKADVLNNGYVSFPDFINRHKTTSVVWGLRLINGSYLIIGEHILSGEKVSFNGYGETSELFYTLGCRNSHKSYTIYDIDKRYWARSAELDENSFLFNLNSFIYDSICP